MKKQTVSLIIIIFLAVSGVGKIWLWSKDASNDFGLYLGIGFCLAAILGLVSYLRAKNA